MPSGKKKDTRLISPFVPILGVGAVAAGFLLLRPGPEAQARGLFQRGEPEAALRVIHEANPSGRTAERLAALELEILADIFMKSDAPVRRRVWADAYALRLQMHEPGENPLPRMTLNLKDPEGLWEPRRDTILTDEMTPEREALIRRMLGVGKPGAAADLLAARIAEEKGSVPVAERVRLADYFRQSGRSGKALDALAPVPDKELTADLRALRIALMRESGKQREALAALVAEIGSRELSPKELAGLHAAALAAAAPGIVTPFFARHLASHPDDAATRRLYSDLLANTGDSREAARQLRTALGTGHDNRKDLERIVQLYGWCDDLPGMENGLLRLAILGDTGALPRLTWAPGIPEDPSLPGKLADAVLAKGRDDELKPAAQYLSAIGDYDLAVRVLRARLARQPDDIDALSACALILFETGDPADALPLLAHAVKLKPENLDFRRRYAASLLVADKGDEALDQYRFIAGREPDAANIAVVRRLAEARGRTGIAADAAEALLRDDLEPKPADFMLAQYFATVAGRREKSLAILRRGVAKFPGDGDLRLNLAMRLSDDMNRLAALDILRAHPGIRTEARATLLWLDLLLLTESREDERAFFADGMPEVIAQSPALRMRAARVLASLGRYGEALDMQQKLVAEFPADRELLRDYVGTLITTGNRRLAMNLVREHLDDGSADSLKFAASAYADNADFRNAERRIRRLLKLPGESTSDNWSALGDYRISAGDVRGARQAYSTAYALLQKDSAKEAAR